MAKYNIPVEEALYFDNRQLNDMKFQDLQRAVASLTREARSRVKSLEKYEKKTGFTSPSLASFERFRDENYSARYKTREQLMEEFAQAKEFLNNETSTVEGTEEYIDEINRRLKTNMTGEDLKNYGKMFRRLEEYFKKSKFGKTSDGIEEDIKNEVKQYKGGDIPWEEIEMRIIQKYDFRV